MDKQYIANQQSELHVYHLKLMELNGASEQTEQATHNE